MTFAVDKVQGYDQALGGYSWSFTPNATTPQGIVVFITTYDNAPGNDYLNGVTYGGVPLTKIGITQTITGGGVTGEAQVWYLPLNTLSGTQTVAVQKSGTPALNSVSVMVVSYTTTTPSTPIRLGSGGYLSFGNTVSTVHSPVTTPNPAHILGVSMEPSLTSPSQTSPHGPFVDVLEDDWGIRMSNYAQVVSTAPGTYDVGWDFSPSASCTTVVLSFEEGNIVYDEGGAGFDEFWDVLGGTDLSSVAGGIALPALSDVNDGIDRGVTTGTLVQWSGTEWVGVTAVDGGAP